MESDNLVVCWSLKVWIDHVISFGFCNRYSALTSVDIVFEPTLKDYHLLRSLPTLGLVACAPHGWLGLCKLLITNCSSDLAFKALHVPKVNEREDLVVSEAVLTCLFGRSFWEPCILVSLNIPNLE